jgi:transposase-like protein
METIEAKNVVELQAPKDVLEEILRDGARRMLQQAIEGEVADYVEKHRATVDEHGRRLVARNGRLPQRELTTGIGPLAVKQPRVRDRRDGEKFTSAILPPYLRRLPSIDALIPALYLQGVSTGDFTEALSAILGRDAPGLSATNVVRLKAQWKDEYEAWQQRDLSAKHYVYLWADGVYFKVRLSDERPCILVLIGALPDGTKELVAVWDGERESRLSWKEVLLDLKRRGLPTPPKLAIGDGALGFWGALREVFPATREQRCWVHKTANVLDKMPKKIQPSAKRLIHEMYLAETKNDALEAFERFGKLYGVKHQRAWGCLKKDKDQLFTFYDFPAEHWVHLRTTNPIESTFATVRLRTRRTKGCGSRTATLMMVFKLAAQAEKHWRRLNGSSRIAQVIEGVIFVDGIHPEEKKEAA